MSRWVRPAEVLWRRTLDGMVVRTPAGETILLSPSAAALLSLLEEPHTAEEAALELAEAAAALPEAMRGGIEDALDDLSRRNLVVRCP